MAIPGRHVFTSERIADRWHTDVDHVNELFYTRRLPQAFLISGSARLTGQSSSGIPKFRPALESEGVRTRVIVSTLHSITNECRWPLSQVRRIYEFAAGDQFGRLSLLQYCDYDRARGLDWMIEFDPANVAVEGKDKALVEFSDLRAYEMLWNVSPGSADQRPPRASVRDTRKQRCRVAAEIIWQLDPQMTLSQLYRHSWIQVIACENKPPTDKAFREWVKDLNPNRQPGRRRISSG